MNLGLLLSLILSPILFLALGLFFGKKGNELAHHPYDVLSFFPYELYQNSRGFYFLMARVMEGLFLLSSLALPIALVSSIGIYQTSSYLSFLIGILAFMSLAVVSFLFLSIVPLPQIKLHLGLYFLYGAFLITSFSMMAFLLLSLGKNDASKESFAVTFAILLFVVSFLIMLLWVNPRLLNFAKMDKVVGPDGEAILKRPRPFVLAFSEWLTVALQILGILLSSLAFYWVL
jgi:hypothetical protein